MRRGGLLAVGIGCQIHSDYLCVPGDALVKTISAEFGIRLPRVKMAFDAFLTVSALILSWIFLGRIEGVREGTFLSVFLVGLFVGVALPRLRWLRRGCYHWVAV